MPASHIRELPPNPNLTHLRKQAKDLKRAVKAGDGVALERVSASHPNGEVFEPGEFNLRDAQVTLAREYGFDGWHELSSHVGEQMVEERDLHRWFGVQLNNEMWKAIEDDSIGSATPALERERLLYSAYASAYHWRTVGDEANFARGEHLISRMAARIGEGAIALRHARRCLELVESFPAVMEDWDLAFAHEAMARSEALVGDLEGAREHLEKAMRLADLVADSADREIVLGELGRGPWFGLKG